MKVAITGAGGRLGRAVARVLGEHGHDVAAWTRQDLDVTNTGAVQSALEAARPAWVVNCAALTNVDRCETDKQGALNVNATAVAALGMMAESVEARLCHVSTDYVFGGEPERAPWREADEPGPVNHYGRTKLLGEEVASRCIGALIVRVALVYGDKELPSFVEKVFERVRAGGEIQTATDMVGSPSYAPEVARATVMLVEAGREGVWHVAGAGGASRHELASVAAEALKPGSSSLIRAVSSGELGLPALRPKDSTLDVTKLEREGGFSLKPWQETVKAWAAAWAGAGKAAAPS
ncbi:MAG TPA: dTDP-4-dehydrorhamnose reductase [Myxococcota bacterium]|jgi:dTDP-4-dehydrorhamnose reductase|nr:dTDP-4-dehydrorhamnose reductase [Myxococcota bacterium]